MENTKHVWRSQAEPLYAFIHEFCIIDESKDIDSFKPIAEVNSDESLLKFNFKEYLNEDESIIFIKKGKFHIAFYVNKNTFIDDMIKNAVIAFNK